MQEFTKTPEGKEIDKMLEEAADAISETRREQKKATRMRREPTDAEIRAGKIGRNAPCICGSGIKFKRCCYRGGAMRRPGGKF